LPRGSSSPEPRRSSAITGGSPGCTGLRPPERPPGDWGPGGGRQAAPHLHYRARHHPGGQFTKKVYLDRFRSRGRGLINIECCCRIYKAVLLGSPWT
jgi:hypothetical protein